MSAFQWFKLFRLYQAIKQVLRRKDSGPNSGHRQFTVTLRNAMFAYDWGPQDFPVRACCKDHAIRLAMDAARDHCEVVEVVEVTP